MTDRMQQRVDKAQEKVEASLEERFKRLRRQLFWSLLLIVLAVAGMSFTSVVLSARAANRANTAQCPLFKTLDQAYQAAKPQSPTGKLVAQEIHTYVLKHCAGVRQEARFGNH